jgi:hypothetical protein
MASKENQQWAFIFEQLGKSDLREMLFKAAVQKNDEGRVVIEFDGEQALNVTEHYNEMESNLDR